MLIVVDKTELEKNLSQPLQTNSKKFTKAVIFLNCHNFTFKVTNKNNEIYLATPIIHEDGFIQISFKPGANKLESLNNQFKCFIIGERNSSEAYHPLKNKPNFSTLGIVKEISRQEPLISFTLGPSIRNLLRYKPGTI